MRTVLSLLNTRETALSPLLLFKKLPQSQEFHLGEHSLDLVGRGSTTKSS
jgi:hypothetical protein